MKKVNKIVKAINEARAEKLKKGGKNMRYIATSVTEDHTGFEATTNNQPNVDSRLHYIDVGDVKVFYSMSVPTPDELGIETPMVSTNINKLR